MTPAALRALLAGRFPGCGTRSGAVEPDGLATGLPAIDAAGGLPRGAITELTCPTSGGGASLLLGGLLAASRAGGGRAALVDAHDAFDPESCPADALSHLVWVRCPTPDQALAAADLLRLRLVLAPSLPLAALEEQRLLLLAALAPVRTRHALAAAV